MLLEKIYKYSIDVVHEIQYPTKQEQNMLRASTENVHVGQWNTKMDAMYLLILQNM